jgi:hypothetical protein
MKKFSVKWLDNRSKQEFIDNIFIQAESYYDRFVNKTYDIPYGYGERTQVGHIAQAACLHNYYTIQDYDVSYKEKVTKGKKKRYRPDLRLWVPSKGNHFITCCFEIKVDSADWTPIDAVSKTMVPRLLKRLKIAYKQLSEYGDPQEGYYRCILVGFRIFCCPSKWQKWGRTQRTYEKKLIELQEQFERAVISIQEEYKPNFFWYYFSSHSAIKRLVEYPKWIPAPGILWSGKIWRDI